MDAPTVAFASSILPDLAAGDKRALRRVADLVLKSSPCCEWAGGALEDALRECESAAEAARRLDSSFQGFMLSVWDIPGAGPGLAAVIADMLRPGKHDVIRDHPVNSTQICIFSRHAQQLKDIPLPFTACEACRSLLRVHHRIKPDARIYQKFAYPIAMSLMGVQPEEITVEYLDARHKPSRQPISATAHVVGIQIGSHKIYVRPALPHISLSPMSRDWKFAMSPSVQTRAAGGPDQTQSETLGKARVFRAVGPRTGLPVHTCPQDVPALLCNVPASTSLFPGLPRACPTCGDRFLGSVEESSVCLACSEACTMIQSPDGEAVAAFFPMTRNVLLVRAHSRARDTPLLMRATDPRAQKVLADCPNASPLAGFLPSDEIALQARVEQKLNCRLAEICGVADELHNLARTSCNISGFRRKRRGVHTRRKFPTGPVRAQVSLAAHAPAAAAAQTPDPLADFDLLFEPSAGSVYLEADYIDDNIFNNIILGMDIFPAEGVRVSQ